MTDPLEILDAVSHVTVSELYRLMGMIDREVSRDTIQRDVQSGRLAGFKVGPLYMIEADSAREYAQSREPYESLRGRRSANPGRTE